MLSKFIVLTAVAIAVGLVSTAQAEEKLMVLWPKQRSAHQGNIDEHGAAYKARGHAFVDHLYSTGGEEPITPADDLSMTGEIEPVPINVGQVADLVKDTEAKSNQTSAPPN